MKTIPVFCDKFDRQEAKLPLTAYPIGRSKHPLYSIRTIMTFSSKTRAFQERTCQTLSIIAAVSLIVGSLVGCSDSTAPESASTEPVSPEGPASSVPALDDQASLEPTKDRIAATPSPTSAPSAESATTEEKSTPKTTTPEESPTPSTPAKVSLPKVEFPEMKMSDKAIAVRDLFIEANNQFKEKRYVGAIQTIRKLDAMDLSEKEEMAVDLFLKRIEKALSADSKTKPETPAQE